MGEKKQLQKLGDYIQEVTLKNKLNEDIPVYSVSNSKGFCKDYFGKEVASQDKTTYKIVPYGCFAYNPSRINVGSVDFQQEEDRVIVSPLYNVFKVKDNLLQKYLLYYLKRDNTLKKIDSVATGTVRSNLKFSMLKEFMLPIPSLIEQQQIVSELDLLSHILDQKRQQLKEYDALAESIFYDMFGDPVENPKGWEVYTLSNIAKLKAGKAIKASELSPNPNSGLYPCFGSNGIRGYIAKTSHSGIYPIIGRQGALCGCVNLAIGDFYATEHAIVVTPLKDNHPIWLFYLLTYLKLNRLAHGQAQPGIGVGDLDPLQVPLPPLSLQQSFAEKIESIEHQKQLLKESIKETETLFQSRMDYWFNA